jgi:glycerol kinase
MTTVLTIDQGTSGTKAIVVDSDGNLLGLSEQAVRPAYLPGGGVEQDPHELLASVVGAGRAAVSKAGVPVDVVTIANQGETVLAWDPDSKRPLSTALSWQDRRAAGICERLAGEADELTRLTGLPLDPYFAAPKITWLREHLTTDGVASTTDAWLVARLTGAFVTDAATASRTLLLDLDRVDWSPEACRAFGVDPATLPAVAGCAEPVGETSAFGPAVPLAGLAVDQQAALFAEACLAAGEAKCTYGTGAFLLATVGEAPRRSSSGLVGCVAWRLGDRTTYCLDGQVYTVGAAVGWLHRVGLVGGPEDLDGLGGQVDSPGGVAFVPGLAGLGAPFWRPAAKGAFTGLSLGTSRAHLVRAVVEGIAAQVAWLAKAAGDDLGQPLRRLRVDGGLTRSAVLMQVQADLLQAPVEVYPSPNATALGVAALARLGAGDATDPAAVTGGWSPSATYEPRIGLAEATERLERWRRAAEATLDLGG